jgi:hypothetical protein
MRRAQVGPGETISSWCRAARTSRENHRRTDRCGAHRRRRYSPRRPAHLAVSRTELPGTARRAPVSWGDPGRPGAQLRHAALRLDLDTEQRMATNWLNLHRVGTGLAAAHLSPFTFLTAMCHIQLPKRGLSMARAPRGAMTKIESNVHIVVATSYSSPQLRLPTDPLRGGVCACGSCTLMALRETPE